MSIVNVHHDLALARADLAALRAKLAKLRDLAAEVVRTHDAPGGCRGQVGWTAMESLATYLSETDDALKSPGSAHTEVQCRHANCGCPPGHHVCAKADCPTCGAAGWAVEDLKGKASKAQRIEAEIRGRSMS